METGTLKRPEKVQKFTDAAQKSAIPNLPASELPVLRSSTSKQDFPSLWDPQNTKCLKCNRKSQCLGCEKWSKCSKYSHFPNLHIKSKFNNFPGEIRNHIYQCIFAPTGYIIFERRVDQGRVFHAPLGTTSNICARPCCHREKAVDINLGFLCTCRQINQEAKHFLTDLNTFNLHICRDTWLSSKRALSIKSFNFHVNGLDHKTQIIKNMTEFGIAPGAALSYLLHGNTTSNGSSRR